MEKIQAALSGAPPEPAKPVSEVPDVAPDAGAPDTVVPDVEPDTEVPDVEPDAEAPVAKPDVEPDAGAPDVEPDTKLVAKVPDARITALIALLQAAGLFGRLFPEADRGRASELAKDYWPARAVEDELLMVRLAQEEEATL